MSKHEFAKGGLVAGPRTVVTVKARQVEGRTEYWEPSIGAWVPVWTAEDMARLGTSALDALNADRPAK